VSDATTTVTSPGNYVVDVDNNNTETDRWFAVTHNNGTELIRVTESGRLGVGVTAPAQVLDVKGNAHIGDPAAAAILQIDGAAATSRDLQFMTGGVVRWVLREDSTAESGSNAGSNFLINARQDDGSSNTIAMFVKRSNGYIGMGNTDPQARLHVSSGADAPYSGTVIYAGNPGASYLSGRNTTDNIETVIGADTATGRLGTVTNHDLVLTRNAGEIARLTDEDQLQVSNELVVLGGSDTTLTSPGTIAIKDSSLPYISFHNNAGVRRGTYSVGDTGTSWVHENTSSNVRFEMVAQTQETHAMIPFKALCTVGEALVGIGLVEGYDSQGGLQIRHQADYSGAKWMFKNVYISTDSSVVFDDDGGFNGSSVLTTYAHITLVYSVVGGGLPNPGPGSGTFGMAANTSFVYVIGPNDEITFTHSSGVLSAQVTKGDSAYLTGLMLMWV
jgi:hypothetical protein